MSKKKKKSQARRNRLDPKKEPAKKKEKEVAEPTTTAQAPTPADETTERKRAHSTDPTAIATARKNPESEESAELKKALKFPRIESWIADLSSPWSKWPLMPAGKQHGVGLHNRGNDCFLNSVLQTVVHTPQLARMVIDPKTKETRVCTKTGNCFHCALQQHILMAVRDSKNSFVAQHIRSQLPRIFPRHIGGRQEDAHEMLALLLDALDPPLPKVKSAGGAKKEVLPEPTELPSTPIQQILGGTLRNKVTCSKCRHEHVSYEQIQEMGVTLPSNSQQGCNVDRLVRDFFSGETISSFKCDKCKQETDVRRETTLLRCPSVLIIYLKRFMPNAGGKGWRKNSITVTPQLELSLDAYTWSGEGGSEKGKSSTSAHYKLNGVVQHWGGGMQSGHYTCVQRGFDGESWFHFDDSTVSPSNEQSVKNTEPYILVYVKKKPDTVETKPASRPASI